MRQYDLIYDYSNLEEYQKWPSIKLWHHIGYNLFYLPLSEYMVLFNYELYIMLFYMLIVYWKHLSNHRVIIFLNLSH